MAKNAQEVQGVRLVCCRPMTQRCCAAPRARDSSWRLCAQTRARATHRRASGEDLDAERRPLTAALDGLPAKGSMDWERPPEGGGQRVKTHLAPRP